ncbi:LytR/AlgR family response regulator transcription factor [Niabella aquatica]
MSNLKCIIVDDEPVARKVVREYIEEIAFLNLAGEFENAPKADTWLKKHPVDIMFLDIEMPKKNGIDFLKGSQIKPLAILTTAYPEYALEGYELDIIDYLLKPISFKRFLKAAQKAKEYIELRANYTGPDMPFIFVRSEKKIEKLPIEEILFIESAGNYIFIHTESRKIIAYLTLKSIEGQLPSNFVKVHHSFLVNFMLIDAIEGNTVKFKNKEVPISRQYKEQLMELIVKRLLKR